MTPFLPKFPPGLRFTSRDNLSNWTAHKKAGKIVFFPPWSPIGTKDGMCLELPDRFGQLDDASFANAQKELFKNARDREAFLDYEGAIYLWEVIFYRTSYSSHQFVFTKNNENVWSFRGRPLKL